eukprot:4788469-Prymnesium_polylepis.1
MPSCRPPRPRPKRRCSCRLVTSRAAPVERSPRSASTGAHGLVASWDTACLPAKRSSFTIVPFLVCCI